MNYNLYISKKNSFINKLFYKKFIDWNDNTIDYLINIFELNIYKEYRGLLYFLFTNYINWIKTNYKIWYKSLSKHKTKKIKYNSLTKLIQLKHKLENYIDKIYIETYKNVDNDQIIENNINQNIDLESEEKYFLFDIMIYIIILYIIFTIIYNLYSYIFSKKKECINIEPMEKNINIISNKNITTRIFEILEKFIENNETFETSKIFNNINEISNNPIINNLFEIFNNN